VSPGCTKTWAESLIGGILLAYADTDPPDSAVLFGDVSPAHPKKSLSTHTGFANDHWSKGRVRPKFPQAIIRALSRYMEDLPTDEATRVWVSLRSPRYLVITGKAVRDQLHGNEMLEHELCCALIRSLRQVDKNTLYRDGPSWRHYLKVDFTVRTFLSKTF
jgi:hypothetical protein